MNATFRLLAERAEIDPYQEIESLIKKNRGRWQSACAVTGLVGGVVAPLLGTMFEAIAWFINSIPVNSYLHVLSIVLCALTIPLLTLGASCLDLLEAKHTRLSPVGRRTFALAGRGPSDSRINAPRANAIQAASQDAA